jgi:hypothetical protein
MPPPSRFVTLSDRSKTTLSMTASGTLNSFQLFMPRSWREQPDDFGLRPVLSVKQLAAMHREGLDGLTRLGADLGAAGRYAHDNAELFAVLHGEGHNIGHFCGAWPFASDKDIPEYEGIEEYRACLHALNMARQMYLSPELLTAFALSIFGLRVTSHGASALRKPADKLTAVDLREIIIAGVAAESAVRRGAVRLTSNGLSIDPPSLLQAMLDELGDIEATEAAARLGGGTEKLSVAAATRMAAIFPEAQRTHAVLELLQASKMEAMA